MGVLASDAFRVHQWRDYFIVVGSGAAALTGLIFVAMSLNVSAVTANTAHRYRGVGSLIGLASVFMLSALVVMGGQGHSAVGTELIVVSCVAGALIVRDRVHTRGFRGEISTLRGARMGTGACYMLQVAGGAVLLADEKAALCIAAIAIVANFYVLIQARGWCSWAPQWIRRGRPEDEVCGSRGRAIGTLAVPSQLPPGNGITRIGDVSIASALRHRLSPSASMLRDGIAARTEHRAIRGCPCSFPRRAPTPSQRPRGASRRGCS